MSVTRWVVLFAAMLVAALLVQLPANWVLPIVGERLRGHIEFQRIGGSAWFGVADVHLVRSGVTLKMLHWRIDPSGLLSLQLRYKLDTANAELSGKAKAGIGFGGLTIEDAELALPARTVGNLVPVISAFSPDGQVTANIRILQCKGERCTGEVTATWNGAALSLAELRPLGDYQIDAVLNDGRADFDVKTLKGTLRAAGKGQFANGALRFTGELSAPPDQLPKVQGLMRLIGIPDERGVLRINR